MLSKTLSATLALTFALLTVANSQASDPDAPFSMTIQDTMRVPKKGVVMTGQIEQGQVRNGEIICVPLKAGGTISSQVEGMEKMFAWWSQPVPVSILASWSAMLRKSKLLWVWHCRISASDSPVTRFIL